MDCQASRWDVLHNAGLAVTKRLDRRFRHVGRIKREWGSDHKATIKAMEGMLTTLYATGRLDILRGLEDRTYSPLQVYDAFRMHELERLPNAKTIVPLVSTMREWIRVKKCSEEHRAGLRQSLRYIEAQAKTTATLVDLPSIVLKLDNTLPDSSFNHLRVNVLGFLRATLKRSHPLYTAVWEIDPHTVTTTRQSHPLTVAEMDALGKQLSIRHRMNAWGMALTGMGPKEYWGKWHIEADRIVIAGTKRKGRNRWVPLVKRIAVPYATPKAFSEALKHVKDIAVTPYDLRRTYANWMEGAGIVRARRMMYLGHGTKDVTDLYEKHQVAQFLAEDAEKLRGFIGAIGESGIRLVNEA